MNLRQRGVALISVLLIVAILMAVASRLLSRHNLVISQHQNTFEQNQALHYALGAEALAMQALYEDHLTSPDIDHLEEIWAQSVLPFELDEGGFLEAQITDLQACFNLNNLHANNKTYSAGVAQRLFNNLGLPPSLVDYWVDWVDPDNEIYRFGAEDSEYLVSQPPRRTANQMVTHASELALIQGIEPQQVRTLLNHVCVLPSAETKINVNTASAQTLAALSSQFDQTGIETVVSAPRNWETTQVFADGMNWSPPSSPPPGQGSNQRQDDDDIDPSSNAGEADMLTHLSVTSSYFQLHAQAQVGETSVTLLSILYRDPNTGSVTVKQRDFGKLFRSNIAVTTEPAS